MVGETTSRDSDILGRCTVFRICWLANTCHSKGHTSTITGTVACKPLICFSLLFSPCLRNERRWRLFKRPVGCLQVFTLAGASIWWADVSSLCYLSLCYLSRWSYKANYFYVTRSQQGVKARNYSQETIELLLVKSKMWVGDLPKWHGWSRLFIIQGLSGICYPWCQVKHWIIDLVSGKVLHPTIPMWCHEPTVSYGFCQILSSLRGRKAWIKFMEMICIW